jgi:hypothetical protein
LAEGTPIVAKPHEPPFGRRPLRAAEHQDGLGSGLVKFIRLLCGDANYLSWPDAIQSFKNAICESNDCLDSIIGRYQNDDPDAKGRRVLLILKTLVSGHKCVKALGSTGQKRAILDARPALPLDGRDLMPRKPGGEMTGDRFIE